ncbi:MAG: energy transducer TonB, partial [Candidatus Binatia bacterium]
QERDRRIQEAVRRMGEKGEGKEAAGLGGLEEGKGATLGTGGDGGGGGILAGLDFIIYKNQVEGIIKRNWTWVGANPNLTVRVGFRIQENGDITDIRVVQRSGDGSYDESVLRAIRISSPLPAPPEKYRDVFGNYLLDFVSGELQS